MDDHREWLHEYLLGHGLSPTFSIDGRTYETADAMQTAMAEAREALNARHIVYERETTTIAADAAPHYLPAWRDVRSQYLPTDEKS